MLVIKFWKATKRAAAILWTRQPSGAIVTTQAVDFGIAPLTSGSVAGADFSTPLAAPALPAVPAGLWETYVTVLPYCGWG